MQTLILGRSTPAFRPASPGTLPPSQSAPPAPIDREVAAHYLGCLERRQALERTRALDFFQQLVTR
ncbi:hypothetical protein [Ramlibacter albus]|uniref:Uncharacterized protein n=1 Tax=Ramlibacter albus TaxID=2079448 RepID=A0A923MDP8_9BURK|nr:hypothetical protein [Ramlibacter albus]MBC5767529.1 hypothetical protein [Ramlibacter albus]